jgi:L-asparaginase II
LGELVGRAPSTIDTGVDGCTLPAAFLTVREMAQACARFAAARDESSGRSTAMRRVLAAMRDHPDYVSGTGEPTVTLTEVTAGRVLIKNGAEGYLAAWVPEAGLGVALKIADGQARAAVPLLIEILTTLDLLTRDEQEALAGLHRPAITSSVGAVVGELRPTAGVATHLQPLPVLALH